MLSQDACHELAHRSLFSPLVVTHLSGSSAFVVLSNKEKAARAGLGRQRISTQCVREDFLGETSFKAVLPWFLGGSALWLSTGSVEEPQKRVKVTLP
jgi:hypothetical protein